MNSFRHFCILLLLLNASQGFAEVAKPPLLESKQLTAILVGTGSPKLNPERAGPAVLIRYGDTQILIDSGNGTQANLAKLGVEIRDLDGLFFTHHHLDHNEEFVPVFIRSLLGNNRFMLVGPTPTVALSESILELYETDIEYRMRRSGRTLDNVMDNYDTKELLGGESFELGGINISTTAVKHTIETIAYRFDVGGQSVVISGDLSYSSSLSNLAVDADVLIIEAGGVIMQGQQPKRRRITGSKNAISESPSSENKHQRAHVTLAETAQMASEAKVKKIVLTHFLNGSVNEIATREELNKTYKGAIVFAVDLLNATDSTATKAVLVESNNTLSRTGQPNANELINRMDKNGDGQIAESEAKGRLKKNFARRDQNNDGFISLDELTRP